MKKELNMLIKINGVKHYNGLLLLINFINFIVLLIAFK